MLVSHRSNPRSGRGCSRPGEGDRGRSGELAEDLVDLGQQSGVVGSVASREGIGRGLAATVTDVPGSAVLGDETVQLGPGEAGRLLEESPHQALVGLPEAVVLEPDQRPADEGVAGAAGRRARSPLVRCLPRRCGPNRECESVRCEVSRSYSNDLFAPDFRLIPRWETGSAFRLVSRWKPVPRPGSFVVGQDWGLTAPVNPPILPPTRQFMNKAG